MKCYALLQISILLKHLSLIGFQIFDVSTSFDAYRVIDSVAILWGEQEPLLSLNISENPKVACE